MEVKVMPRRFRDHHSWRKNGYNLSSIFLLCSGYIQRCSIGAVIHRISLSSILPLNQDCLTRDWTHDHKMSSHILIRACINFTIILYVQKCHLLCFSERDARYYKNNWHSLWKSDLLDEIKPEFFHSKVVSVLLYCCTTWSVTTKRKKKGRWELHKMLGASLNVWQSKLSQQDILGTAGEVKMNT